MAIALPIARGLAAAHARGIIHRDLKPDNVFLRSDGGVKILDFGVAKLLPAADARQGDASETVGVIVGTAGYMAPEQVTGARLDVRADLFALGVMLYEMLAGRRPLLTGRARSKRFRPSSPPIRRHLPRSIRKSPTRSPLSFTGFSRRIPSHAFSQRPI